MSVGGGEGDWGQDGEGGPAGGVGGGTAGGHGGVGLQVGHDVRESVWDGTPPVSRGEGVNGE